MGAAAGVALLFASLEAAVFPPKLNRLGVEEEVVAGFAPPNKDDPAPVVWLLCWPNKEEPDWAPPLDWAG